MCVTLRIVACFVPVADDFFLAPNRTTTSSIPNRSAPTPEPIVILHSTRLVFRSRQCYFFMPLTHSSSCDQSILHSARFYDHAASSSPPSCTREPEQGNSTPPSDWVDTPVPVNERVPLRPECQPKSNGSDECESSDDCCESTERAERSTSICTCRR
jgi:hypothetical protein